VASRKLDACETVADEIRAKGRKALAVAVHAGRWDDIDRLIDVAYAEFGRVDILVNNAGGPPPGVTLPHAGFMTSDDDTWRGMFEFNLFSVIRMIRSAVPVMLEGGGGAIVNVSSVTARQPSAVNMDYGAAKSALTFVSKAVDEEYGPQGIRVNTVSPGPVLTPWWTDEGGAADVFGGMVGADRDSVITKVAPEMMKLTTGRLVTPQEVADAIALLVSPRSGSTAGADLVIDGGCVKEV